MRGLFVFSTNTGSVSCIDMRCQSPAFELHRDLHTGGYASTLLVDPWCTWFAMGTSTGLIELYDFRFMLPVQSFQHPQSTPVTRLCSHPTSNNQLVASYRANNELRVFRLDSTRKSAKPDLIFWGVSYPPPLSTSNICVNKFMSSLVAVSSESDDDQADSSSMISGILCASSDMKLRYIDLTDPVNGSEVFSTSKQNTTPSASFSPNTTFLNDFFSDLTVTKRDVFELKYIDDTQVLVEKSGNDGMTNVGSASNLSSCKQKTYHRDVVSDLVMCCSASSRSSSALIITGDRDGSVKIWK